MPAIEYESLMQNYLDGVIALCEAEEWPSYIESRETTWRALSAPGSFTVVAVHGERVVGSAQVLSDGVISGCLALVLVAKGYRRQGIGQRLVEEAFWRSGAKRLDVISIGADEFYRSIPHREYPGFRVYPGYKPDGS